MLIFEDEFADLDDNDLFGSGGISLDSGERVYDNISLIVRSKVYPNCRALVEYEVFIDGRYSPPTQYNPAEYPELIIDKPKVRWFEIAFGLRHEKVGYALRYKAGGVPYYEQISGLALDLADDEIESILGQILEYFNDEEEEVLGYEKRYNRYNIPLRQPSDGIFSPQPFTTIKEIIR